MESLVVDMLELQGKMTYPLPVDGTIYLTARDTTVKIVYKRLNAIFPRLQ